MALDFAFKSPAFVTPALLRCQHDQALQAKGRFADPRRAANCRGSRPRDISVRGMFGAKAPPPPPFWSRPSTWAVITTCIGAVVAIAYLVRKLRPRRPRGGNMSMADMYFQLEKSAGVPTVVKTEQKVAKPMAPLPPPTTTAVPPTTAATTAPLPPAPTPAPPPSEMPPPPAPTEQPVPPAAVASPPEPAKEEPTAPPAAPAPPPAAVAPPPPTPEPTKAAEEDAKEKKGFGWLLNRTKTAEVPSLRDLLQSADERPPVGFLRAVASELCLDVPDGTFQGVEGITVVPAAVPEATRTALLHAAVKSEAEKLEAKERAEGVMTVAKSMVCELVDGAAGLKDKKAQIEALDKLVLFAVSCEGLTAELAPDVEAGKLVYEGAQRYKVLEGLYDTYLDQAVDEMQQTTAAMFGSMMGGEDKATESVEQMTARAEQAEKQRSTLAAVFKISEGKAEKLMEKKMKVATEKAQKELMAGLMSGNQ